MVGDGHAMDVAAQITEHMLGASEGLSNFNDEFPDAESCMQLNLFNFQWDSSDQ
jgi:hypothetical protein